MKFIKHFNNLIVEIEANKIEDGFEKLSEAEEIFGNSVCGACGSEDVYPVTREIDGNKYHEIQCRQCDHKLSFGKLRDGSGLFPKRKDADNNKLENNGWHIYKPSASGGGGKPPQNSRSNRR